MKNSKISDFLNKKIFINIAFFGLLLISLAGFIFVFNTKDLFFNIPIFGTVNDNLVINVEVPEKFRDNLHFFADGKEIPQDKIFDKNTYATYIYDNSDAKNIYFILDNNNIINEINNIVIQLNNFYYFNNQDIKNFERGKNGEYFLPNKDIKYCKNSEYPTDKGFGHRIFIYIMSVFYNSKYYILPLFCFALAVLIYQKNKEKFNFNFTFFKNSAIWWILILGIFLRIHYMARPYWHDEIFTVLHYSDISDYLSIIYQDKGNPPLFYLILRLWMYIGGNSEIWTRVLSCIFSVLTIGGVYYFVKKNVNNSLAIISAFWLSVNFISIYSAQESRSYALGGLLVILSSYYLLLFLKEKRNKDFIIYSVLAILMANTHYFLILILISNFLYALLLSDNKSKIKLFFANIFAISTYLPHFLLTGITALSNYNFNVQLKNNSVKNLFEILTVYTGSYIVTWTLLIIFICMLIPQIRKVLIKENEPLIKTLLYSFYTIFSLFTLSYLFSVFFRPIIETYYYVLIIGLLGIYICGCLFLPFKNKLLRIIICLGILTQGGLFYTGVKERLDTGRGYIASCLTYDVAFKYSFFNQLNYKNKTTAIACLFSDLVKKHYKEYIRENENILSYDMPFDFKNFKETIKNNNADITYYNFVKFDKEDFEELNKKYNVGIILSDNHAAILRLEKK